MPLQIDHQYAGVAFVDYFTLFVVAVGLAMDAFAVSISCGISIEELKKRHAVRIAVAFGLFQALMPLLGWAVGLGFRDLIAAFDHWIAMVLLGFVGGHMLWESRENCQKKKNPLDWHVLLMMAIATSIDALAVGLTFAVLDMPIVTPVILIGLVTFLMSGFGVFLGDRAGCFFGKKVEIVGGLILIAIGLKIVLEHVLKGI